MGVNVKHIIVKLTLVCEKMKDLLEILENNVPEIAKQVQLELPKLELPKLQKYRWIN